MNEKGESNCWRRRKKGAQIINKSEKGRAN